MTAPERNTAFAPGDPSATIVEMRKITKVFGSVVANENIDLTLRKGEVHALLGENGAGKSTLANILYGNCSPTSGTIFLRGRKIEIGSPRRAIRNGIGMVHQHFMLIRPFTVTENIVLGREPRSGIGLNMKKAVDEVEELSARYGLSIDPLARISDITVAMQQKVEILKALYRNAEVLILDEPTAVLSPQEIDSLTEVIRNLASDGKAVLLITHKLKEVRNTADICTIIRKGRRIDSLPLADVTEDELAEKMVGRRVVFPHRHKGRSAGPAVLEIEGLDVLDGRGIKKVHNLSLDVRAGEILSVVGVDGNGQSELVEAVTGLRRATGGRVVIKGKDVTGKTPREIIESGVGYVPEDRQGRGLILDFTIAENLILKNYRTPPFSRRGILYEDAIGAFAGEAIAGFDIRTAGQGEHVRSLSGGNQQKVVLAREIPAGSELLIAVQPTRGLDVGAMEYVYAVLEREKSRNKAVLLVTLDLDEALYISDRIAVICEGHIVGLFSAEEADKRRIGLLMAGGRQ